MGVSTRKASKNKKVTGVYRNAIKKTRKAITEKDVKKASEELKNAIKALDKASQKKVLKKNTASRYKSRLNKAVKNISK